MSKSLGPRARARTRRVKGETIHEVLVYRGAGPPSAIRFPSFEIAERQAAIFDAELNAGTLDAPSEWQMMIDAFLDARAKLRPGTKGAYLDRAMAGRPSIKAVK